MLGRFPEAADDLVEIVAGGLKALGPDVVEVNQGSRAPRSARVMAV